RPHGRARRSATRPAAQYNGNARIDTCHLTRPFARTCLFEIALKGRTSAGAVHYLQAVGSGCSNHQREASMTTKSPRSMTHSDALRNPDERRRVPRGKPRHKVTALTAAERRELVEH